MAETKEVELDTDTTTVGSNLQVGRKAVGDFKLDLPSADPSVGLEEIERRHNLVTDPGPSTILPPDVMAQKRREFENEYSGYWIVNCANAEFSTKCDCPNIRLIDFVQARKGDMAAANMKADAHIVALMKDPRVTSIPIKIPAHGPFQIPLSEASARNAAHTHGKIQRNVGRYMKFNAYRQEEFNRHVEDRVPGEMGRSSYARRKAYLSRQKAREQSRDGRMESAIPLPAAAAAAPEPSGEPTAAVGSDEEAPPPVWTGALPEHWTVRPEGALEVNADSWPRDLESRHGKFAVLAFIDDEDESGDSAAFPAAAKREPIVILFGGMHESIEEAKEFMMKRISPWCPDLCLDVVDMYEWLWPTEVDPDTIPEQHRTQHAGFDKELNTVMTTRKATLATAAEAREQAESFQTPLRESNVNAIPDISEVVSATRNGMVSYALTTVEDEAEKKDDLPSIQ